MRYCFSKIKTLSELLGNIAEFQFLSHLLPFSICLIVLFSSVFSQPRPTLQIIVDTDTSGKPPLIFPLSKYPKFAVSDEDVADTINTFKTNNPSKQVEKFKQGLAKPITDKNVQKEVIKGIYKLAKNNIIEDKDLEMQIRQFFAPVLKLYNRQNYYEFIILKHPTPYISIGNPGSVIVVTTGLFAEALSDDELLGYISHEVGHEYFYHYSRYTKHLFNLTESRDKENALNRHIVRMLGIIEMQCDAFAAITMAHLGYNPITFLEGTERTGKTFEMDKNAVHPPIDIRKKTIFGILDKNYFEKETKTSSFLIKMRKKYKNKVNIENLK